VRWKALSLPSTGGGGARRLARASWVALVLVTGGVAGGCAAHGSSRTDSFKRSQPSPVSAEPRQTQTAQSGLSFGAWAGYVWSGRVASVGASWVVPRILSRSPRGFAGTWIGAQAPAPRSRLVTSARLLPRRLWTSQRWSWILRQVPFIQVGTYEGRVTSQFGQQRDVYYAFWTDTVHDFRPITLFVVRPGDVISAKLTLAAGRWSISVLDGTSGLHKDLLTSDDTHAVFNAAEWLQEHAQYHPFSSAERDSYPQLSTVGMRGLRVNSGEPLYANVLSTWMSADGEYFAPSQLGNGSFVIRRAGLSPAGKRYLMIAEAENAAAQTFGAQLSVLTVATPRRQIAAQIATFAKAMRPALSALASERWPHGVKGLMVRLTAEQRAWVVRLGSASARSRRGLTWRSSWIKQSLVAHATALAIRRALNIPQTSPTQ
jgi:hypothetical protein